VQAGVEERGERVVQSGGRGVAGRLMNLVGELGAGAGNPILQPTQGVRDEGLVASGQR